MKPTTSPTIDDVARLIRGKRSKNRVGSRQIRHRLRQDELQRLSVARERGFLVITASTRNALCNAWHLDCTARNRPCLFVERTSSQFIVKGEHGSVPVNEQRATLAEIISLVESM